MFQKLLLPFDAQLLDAKFPDQLSVTEQPRESLNFCQDAESAVPVQTQSILLKLNSL